MKQDKFSRILPKDVPHLTGTMHIYHILYFSYQEDWKIPAIARDEIERIKKAEEEAIILVTRTREEAGGMQEKAREESDHYLLEAHQQALEEIERYRVEKIDLARHSASEIIENSMESARRMEMEYKERMTVAAFHIAGQVTGRHHVLPGRDEKSSNRSP